LCARRGFDIKAYGNLPSSGTILCVQDLNLDRALVLLSLYDDARVYADRAFEASDIIVRALSVRVSKELSGGRLLESLVGDLAVQRTLIMSARHGAELEKTRRLDTPMRRVRVEIQDSGATLVLVEA
jgi:hypothetical protein